jgi:hypothetical protein
VSFVQGTVAQSQSIAGVNLLLNPGDQIGIRNDADNNQAIGFVIQNTGGTTFVGTVNDLSGLYGTASTTYNYGSGTYGGSVSLVNYGKTAIIIEDSNQTTSLASIQFNKIYNTTLDNWDYKLWNPINKNYRLQRGYLNLPNPITAKYIKIEFSKLSPSPYEGIYNPNLPEIFFKAYPSWVVAYINDTYSQVTSLNQIKAETVNYNLINTGIQKPNTTLLSDPQPESILSYVKTLAKTDITQTAQTQYNNWLNYIGTAAIQTPVNQSSQFYPNTLYKQDSLFNTVQNPNPLSQSYLESNPGIAENYSQETSLNSLTVGPITARTDQTIVAEKNYPDLWFPRICRHGYQVVQTPRTNQIAYNVAIQQIGFYKKDRSIPTNDSFYYETLSDISNADPNYVNTFVQSDWKFVVPPSTLALGSNIPLFGFENFDVEGALF